MWMKCVAQILGYQEQFDTYECRAEHPYGDAIILSYIPPNPTIKKCFAQNDFVLLNVPFLVEDGIYVLDDDETPEIIREYVPANSKTPPALEHPLFGKAMKDPHNEVDWNTEGQCGIIKYASGKIYMGAGRSKTGINPGIELNPQGTGVRTASLNLFADAFTRRLGDTESPVILDQFAKYYGNDEPDDPLPPDPSGILITKRSFVPRSMDVSEGYVSTSEGADAPFLGVNNDTNKIIEKSSAMFRKYIYDGTQRLEIVAGDKDDPNDSFLSVFLNTIGTLEKSISADAYSPAIVASNQFYMHLMKEGGMEIGVNPLVAIPPTTFKNATFKFSVGNDGSTLMEVATGAKKMASLELTPTGDINITAFKECNVDGAKVNLGKNAAKFLCNNFGFCLFTGAPHSVGNTKVFV